MLSYVRPVIGLNDLFVLWRMRYKLARQCLEKLEELFNGKVYVSKHERHILYHILRDLRWSEKTILVPDFTCPSMTEAINRSGNKTVTYQLKSTFGIDEHSFREGLDAHPDAVLASHVYGHPMPVRELISEYFDNIQNRPLLISDLAHARSIDPRDVRAEGYDIVLYSLSYYKPMPFPDLGVGVVRNPYYVRENNIELDDSAVRTLFELVLFYGREIVLQTPILKLLYQIAPPKFGGSYWSLPPSKALSLNVACLDHVIGRSRLDLRWQFSHYDNLLVDVPQVRPLTIDRQLASYYPITVEPRHRNQIHKFCLRHNIYLGRIFSYIIPNSHGIDRYSDWLADSVMNLPIGSHVTTRDIEHVVRVLQKYFTTIGNYDEGTH